MTPTRDKGFLLTRSSFDRRQSTEIEYWVATDSGPAKLLVSSERPVFFIRQSQMELAINRVQPLGHHCEISPLQLKLFDGEKVSAVYTSTINDQYTAVDLLQYASVETFEADIRLHDRHVLERFVNGAVEFIGEAISREGYTEYRNCRLKAAEYTPTLRCLSLDIECSKENEIFSVGLSDNATVNVVLMVGSVQHADTEVLWYSDEARLLKGLVDRITAIDPDLIVGWNVINFDFRILCARAEALSVRFDIGRGGKKASWRQLRGDPSKGYMWIPGRLAIDGIDALRSATWSFPSFSLESVAQALLGRGKKVEQDVDDRYNEIVENFLHNKPALAAYNLEDCRLVLDIFADTQIIEYLILRSQMTGLELDRAGGSVAAFTNLYLPRLHRAGYVAPNLPGEGGLASPGGYVMDSTPGLYRNVLVLDFKSLYPSIIRTFKIDPLGMIEGLQNPDQAIAGFKGGVFHRTVHFLPQIITNLWQQRDIAKRNNDSVQSQAIKIIMNSFYGVLGSSGCRFYDPRLASSITMRGHEIMQTTRGWIEELGYQVIYGDTDSTFVALDADLSAEKCREIGRSLESVINQRWTEHVQNVFDLESFLELEFETYFVRFLMPTIRGSEAGSKKRYAGMLPAASGLEPKLIFKGLENVRTDWTAMARDFQALLYRKVFNDEDPSELIRQTVNSILTGEVDDQLIYRKQLRRKLKLYDKNVPPHVRAARLADEKNRSSGKSLRYQNKGWINYAITVNGPEAQEYLSSPMDYEHYIDRQIKPVADAVLPFIGLDFETIVSAQQAIF